MIKNTSLPSTYNKINDKYAFNENNPELSNTINSRINKVSSSNSVTSDQSLNLSLNKYIELKSHFDVVRKLGYLPNLNALVSISEVIAIVFYA